jgi:transcriptional regulator GlxA family with amidase domain
MISMQGKNPPKQLRIGIILAKYFTMSAFSLFVDTLRLASDEGDLSRRIRCDWEVLSSTRNMIRSSAGVDVAPTAGLGDPARFTHIAVVGGLLRGGESLDRASIDFLHQVGASEIPLIGICTGAFILARCGLMQGRKACVSWFHYNDFKDSFPNLTVIADRLYLMDGNRITCSGGVGAADLAAHLVKKHLGEAAMLKAMQVLQIERVRSAMEPQPRTPPGMQVTDARVVRALQVMERNQPNPIKVSEVAAQVSCSARELERVFLKHIHQRPSQVYMNIRLETARQLLISTNQKIIDIAVSTGFAQHSTFSSRFKREFKISPSKFRSQRRNQKSELGI